MIGTRRAGPAYAGIEAPAMPGMGPVAVPGMETPQLARPSTGMFDRIRDFLGSDVGRAALLRSGAATLNGGLGAGIAAGAGYVDQQKQMEAGALQRAIENTRADRGIDIQQQGVDQTGDYQAGQLGLGVARQEEDVRARIAQNRLTGRGQDIQQRGQNLNLQDAREGRAVTIRGQDIDSADRNYGINTGLQNDREGRTNQRMVATIGAGSRENVAETRAAGIGSKGNRQPAAIVKQALPLPGAETDLQDGKWYNTAQGVKQWSADQRAFF